MKGMEASVQRLQKRLGGSLVNDLLARLRNHDFEYVARTLLDYYDKLYDKHVANSNGSGSGVGTRAGHIVDVCQDDDLDYLDAPEIARQVLAKVAEFEAGESHLMSQVIRTKIGDLQAGTGSTDQVDTEEKLTQGESTKPYPRLLMNVLVPALTVGFVLLGVFSQRQILSSDGTKSWSGLRAMQL